MINVQSFIGFLLLTGMAWLISEDRSKLNWKTISIGLLLQLFLAALLIKVPVVQNLFIGLNRLVHALETATQVGTAFVFGYLGGGRFAFPRTATRHELYSGFPRSSYGLGDERPFGFAFLLENYSNRGTNFFPVFAMEHGYWWG